MVSWQKENYLDPGIWNQLRSKICPEILPASSSSVPPSTLSFPAPPVVPSIHSPASSEDIDPTFQQCVMSTTMYTKGGGRVLRKRVTEEAVIMPVPNNRDENTCPSSNQPAIMNTDSQITGASLDSVHFETPDDVFPTTAEQRVTDRTVNNSQANIEQSFSDTFYVRKKGTYGGKDFVDQFLLNQVAKHVKLDQLGSMSRDLGVRDSEYMKITAPNVFSEKDQIYKVSK